MRSSLGTMTDTSADDTLSWFELAVAVNESDADLVTDLLAGLGFEGSEIVDLGGARTEMRVFLQAADDVAAAQRAQSVAHALGSTAGVGTPCRLDENVWRDDWKRHFERITVGERFEIFPPWDSAAAVGSKRLAVVINPGMAFGTGRHETTAGCMELLESVVRPGDAVLDLGCGSGILAIAAAKLGARRVLAVDNDSEALNAATENIVMNAVENQVEVFLHEGPPPGGEGAFDVVVANILAEPLAEMAAPLTACVKDAGVLVLSGIESKRRALVEVAYGRQGWRVTRDLDRSGWVSLALQRR